MSSNGVSALLEHPNEAVAILLWSSMRLLVLLACIATRKRHACHGSPVRKRARSLQAPR